MKKYPQMTETDFGHITLGAKTYEHDVYVLANGKIKRRDKSIAKEQYGTSHKIGRKELKRVCRKRPELLFVGAGHDGQAKLTGKGRKFLSKRGIGYRLASTPELLAMYNRSKARKAALVHVTC